MIRKICIFFIIIFFISGLSYALDWRQIHEEADKSNLNKALSSVNKNPDSLADLYLLGLVYLNEHKDKEAADIFNKIISLEPESIEGKWGIAETLRRDKKLAQSEKILSKLIESRPDFSPAYISLAYIKYTNKKFKKSVKLARAVIKQGRENVDLSNYTRAYLMFSGAHGMLAYYGGPLAKIFHGTHVYPNLKKAENLQPDSPAVLFGLGSFYLLAPSAAGGNVDKAYGYLKKAVEIDPLFADAYVRLAQYYKAKDDIKQYEFYLNKALEIDAGNFLALDEKSGECVFICVSPW